MSNKVNVMIGTEGKQRSVTRVFIFFSLNCRLLYNCVYVCNISVVYSVSLFMLLKLKVDSFNRED